jgi:hypothetical protein
LTEEEVAAIDAAGAKGPPLMSSSEKEHLFKLIRRGWALYLLLVLGYFLFAAWDEVEQFLVDKVALVTRYWSCI